MHLASKRSGRISFVVLAAILCVGFVCVLIFASGKSARGAAGEFMTALSNGDPEKLANLSMMGEKSKDEMKKAWQDSITYSRSFLFHWDITSAKDDGKAGVAVVQMTKNPLTQNAYPEKYELQLVKVGDDWKVDVTQIPRDMFPFLPH
jgi:hypothetical protein